MRPNGRFRIAPLSDQGKCTEAYRSRQYERLGNFAGIKTDYRARPVGLHQITGQRRYEDGNGRPFHLKIMLAGHRYQQHPGPTALKTLLHFRLAHGKKRFTIGRVATSAAAAEKRIAKGKRAAAYGAP